MKHLLKIGSLVVVLVCILVSNSFAGSKKISSPAILGESYADCIIRNIDDERQIDGTIEACQKKAGCAEPVPFSLNPGEVAVYGLGAGEGYYYCNFEVSNKKVSASICSDIGCMAVPKK